MTTTFPQRGGTGGVAFGDPATRAGERATVLVIEDSRSISAALSHRLTTALGVDVVACATAQTCRDVLAHDQRFDIAIVDLNLPGASDGEILQAVVARDIPAVVFTATFDLDLREKIVERGVADYIIKDNDRALDLVVASVERLLLNRLTKVLVVDDSRSAREIVIELLRLQQFQVLEAHTGQEALEILKREGDVALVLTDYHMPDMDGYQLTRLIRKAYGSEELRIIGISSSTDRLLSASFLKAGACDFVYRPYVAEELQCRINLHVQALSQIRQLRSAAYQDFLTGLYNRRYFFREGPKLVQQCLDNHRPCNVAILDVDHFKRLNDTHGHEAGDRVLKLLAERLTAYIKGSGLLLGRLGGEEFGMILPGMTPEDATAYCDAMRREVAGLMVALPHGEAAITISIGLAEVAGREVFDNYLNAADQFLYLAKRGGRNLVYSDISIQMMAGRG